MNDQKQHAMLRVTERPSLYDNLEQKTVMELITSINAEDMKVAPAIREALPALEKLITAVERQLRNGGRMFYLGCGSGGRLAVLDSIELPNTYGIEKGMMNVVLAGGVDRLVEAPEEKEDEEDDGWKDLLRENVSPADIVIGISASGTTPYVFSGLKWCQEHRIPCGSIVHNPNSPISEHSDYPVEIVMGPEFVTGSTRMKCGTAQKIVFDMISTTVLIRLGHVVGNRMVDVRLTNKKVIDRSVRMILELSGLENYDKAHDILLQCGSVRKSVDYIKQNHIR